MVRALITPNSTIIQIHQYPELEMKISKIPNSQNSEFNQISRLCNQNKKANKHQNRKFKIRNLLLDSSEIGRRHSTHLLLSEPYHLWIHHSVKHSSSLSLSKLQLQKDQNLKPTKILTITASSSAKR